MEQESSIILQESSSKSNMASERGGVLYFELGSSFTIQANSEFIAN